MTPGSADDAIAATVTEGHSVQDLGALAWETGGQPLLIFGGPYSNLAATKAIRHLAEQLQLPAERVICTGDIVAYCAEAEATTALIRQWGIPVVMGNCEESLATGALDCGCGFDANSSCSLLSVGWYAYARQQVSADACQWMGTLPRSIRFTLNGKRFQLVHGGVQGINRFLFAGSDDNAFAEQWAATDADVVIGGHCGIPFARRFSDSGRVRHWLNAGVIGMPANDGTPDGWFLLLSPEQDTVRVSWHRLVYPVAETQQAMLDVGLNTPYYQALASGLWPSLDVLPPGERAVAGQPLTFADYRL